MPQPDASDLQENEASDKKICKKDPKIAVSLSLSNGQKITGKISLADLKDKEGETNSLLHRQVFSTTGEFAYLPHPHTNYIIARLFGAGGNGGTVLRTESGELAVASGGNSGNIAVSARFDASRLKKLIVGKPEEWTMLLGTNDEILLKVAPGQSGKTAILKTATTGFSGINAPNLPSEGDVLSFEIPGAIGERGIIFNGDPAAPLILGGKGGSTAYGHGGLGGILVQNSAQHATGYGSGGGGAAAAENSPRNPGGNGAAGFIILEEYH
ncbi:hypothetical protein FAI41_04815 [Acetobacteraceae bacterium]|nr:hypothetical protein FAI41_04815 [Acetobacteraceae bacterium]